MYPPFIIIQQIMSDYLNERMMYTFTFSTNNIEKSVFLTTMLEFHPFKQLISEN